MDLDNIEWKCDSCDAVLNEQPGFNTSSGRWTCTECGELNFIDESEILSQDEYDDFFTSNASSYNEYLNSSERLPVSEAAEIWLSSGRDEDQMFGYTEEELEDALN